MSGPGSSKSRKNKAKKARQKARRTLQAQDGAEVSELKSTSVPQSPEQATNDLVEGHDTQPDDPLEAPEHNEEVPLTAVVPEKEENSTESRTDFEATLVGGLLASKLQEYIPVNVDQQKQRMQFEPTQEQLTVAGIDSQAPSDLDPEKQEIERRNLERESIHAVEDLNEEPEENFHVSPPLSVPANVPLLIQGSEPPEDYSEYTVEAAEEVNNLDNIVSKSEEIPEATEAPEVTEASEATEATEDTEADSSAPTNDGSLPSLIAQTTRGEIPSDANSVANEHLRITDLLQLNESEKAFTKETAELETPILKEAAQEETASRPIIENPDHKEAIGLGVEMPLVPETKTKTGPIACEEKDSTVSQFENTANLQPIEYSAAQTPSFPWDNQQETNLPWEQPSQFAESAMERMRSLSPSEGPNTRPEELLNTLASANNSKDSQTAPLAWDNTLKEDDFFLSLNNGTVEQIESRSETIQPTVDKFAKLDDIFGDDSLDDIDISVEKEVVREQDSTKVDKLKSLAFLDDELLFDDEPENPQLGVTETSENPVVQESIPKKNHYLPSSTPNAPNYAAITEEADKFKQNLEAAKKKNDAYDFPGLPDIKPLRAASKYSNRAGSGAQLNAPPTVGSSTESVLPPTNQAFAPPSGSKPPQAGSNSSSKTSSFFLELPLDLPTKAARPAKVKPAILPQIQKNQTNSLPPPGPAQSATKPNPYAPKPIQGPQISPKISSGIVAPGSSFEPAPGLLPGQYGQQIGQPHPPIASYGQPLQSIGQGVAKPYVRPPVAQSIHQYASHSHLPNQSNQNNQLHVPPNLYGQVPQHAPQQYGQNFSQSPVPNSTLLYSTPSNAPRRLSNNQPQAILTTNLPKLSNQGSATSPYVPVSGPYAPSGQRKTHSRASSLIGGKVGNPYAPVSEGSPSVPKAHVGLVPPSHMPLQAGNTIVPAQMAGQPGLVPLLRSNRSRAISNARSNTYKEQKITDPSVLLKKQFPIFNWGYSGQIVSLIPNQYPAASNNVYMTSSTSETITVTTLGQKFNLDNAISQFPGPLTSKSKKKDVEKWLQNHIDILASDPLKENDLLLNQILLSLVRCDSDVNSSEFHKEIIPILNPSVNYNETFGSNAIGSNGAPTAYKLDTHGLSILLGYLQSGKTEEALLLAISKADYAMALIISYSLGPETFQRVASDYARGNFPFQKLPSKVHHLMPIIIKAFAGASTSAILDFNNVASEGEWALQHWRDILAAVVANGNSQKFCAEFASFLYTRGNLFAADICNTLSGANGTTIQNDKAILMGQMYSEILEFIYHGTESNNFAILLKLKHAQSLTDFGFLIEAQRYIDYLSSKIKLLSNQGEFGTSIIAQFQNLAFRLQTVTSEADQGWFGNKISKVKLDKMWGHLDKFIGGEELKETNGVFSKFSPSVLRTTSTVDLTLTASTQTGFPNDQSRPQTSRHHSQPFLPHTHGEDLRRSSYGNSSLPFKASPKHTRADRPPVPQGESYIGNYSPFNTPSINSLPQPQPVESVLLSQSYARVPPNASTNVPLNELQPPAFTPQHNSHSRIQKKLSSASRQTYQQDLSFGNEHYHENSNNVQASSLTDSQQHVGEQKEEEFRPTQISSPVSIHSHISRDFGQTSPLRLNENNARHSQNASFGVPDALSNPPESRQSFEKYPESMENFGNPDVLRQQNHSPSIQSDISIDMVPKTFGDLLKPREALPELIEHEKASISPIFAGEKQMDDQVELPAVKGELKTETPIKAPPPPAAKQRANPYAPGGTAATKLRVPKRNKYGPPPGSNTAFVSPIPSKNEGTFHQSFSLSTPLSQQHPKAEERPLAIDHSVNQEESIKSPIGAPPLAKEPETKDEISQSTTKASISDVPPPPPLNYTPIAAPKARFTPAVSSFKPSYSPKETDNNVDTSFNLDDAKYDGSYGLPRDTQVSQENMNKLQTYNTFDEFSVPGSPDLTTRANSIVGGHHGNNLGGGGVLFSSRLSQSQQLAMYQQYEVQDDTVKDYIPFVEEDEEDEDVAKKEQEEKENQERQRKKEEENKKRATAEASAMAEAEGKKPKQEGGWFKFFGSGKDDDKPKPIKAKMGEKNAFVYDEKLKKWINKNIPLEEQLKESGPPPPPKMKNMAPPAPRGSNVAGMPPIGVSGIPPAASSSASQKPDGNGDVAPAMSPAPPTSNPSANSSAPSLINAGLDDLLTLGKPTMGGARKGKRTSKRGYVNVLNQ